MKKIARYLKPYAFLAIISPLMMMCEVLADLMLPKLMSFIVDYGIAEGGLDALTKAGGFPLWVMQTLFGSGYNQMNVIVTFGVMMLCLTAVGGFFGVFCAYTSARAAQGFGHDLRTDAYRRVMSLSIEQTDKFTTGSLITRMTGDISMIVELVESLTRHFVRAPVFIIGGTIMLLSLNVKFGVILLGAIPILGVTIFIVLKKAIPMFTVVQKKLDNVNNVVGENVGGARVVKAYVCEAYECARFNDANNDLVAINLKVLKLMAVITPVLHVVQNGAVIALLAVGAVSVGSVAGMTVGTVMAGITYVTQVVNSIMMVTMMFQSISRSIASGKRLVEVLDTEPKVVGGDEKTKDDDVVLSFRDVSFRYPDAVGAPVLHDINLDVKKGETLAVIGATGSGKTSLVRLIPRFYDVTSGSLLFRGTPIEKLDLADLRSRIGYVMQKSELFSDTIKNNILWGKTDATEEEIQKAADMSSATEFIKTRPHGIEQSVEEKGMSLSGGQKQRLSLARAMIRHPEVLILDDATSALDLVTEDKVQQALKENFADTTVIYIAQRIASVKNADRIAVIENGTICDCAPHDVLMTRCETYRDIYASQMKAEDEGGVN